MKRSRALSALLVAIAVLLSAPIFLRSLVPLDEGALVHVAERLAGGEVLYRDVATGVMPGSYYLFALLFLLFEPSLELGRAVQVALLAATTVLLFHLARRFASEQIALGAALFFLCIELFAYRYPNYSPFAVFFILLSMLAFLDYLDEGRGDGGYVPLSLGGTSLAVSFLFKQNYAATLFAVFAGVLLASLWHRRSRESICALLCFGAAFGLPILLVLVLLALAGALRPLLDYTVFSVVSDTLPTFFKSYPILDLRDPLAYRRDLLNYLPFPPLVTVLADGDWRPPLWLEGLLVVSYLAVPALLFGAVARVARRSLTVGTDRRELVVVLAAAALFLGVFPRSDYHHLLLVVSLPIVVGALLWERVVRSWRAPVRWLLAAAVGLFGLFSAVAPYLLVVLDVPERQDTPLELTRARHLRVSARDAIQTRGVVRWLRASGSEPFLVIPNDPLYYFLVGRPNPTPFPLALPGSFDEARLLAALPAVDEILYRDVAFDGTPIGELFPDLVETLDASFTPDPDYLEQIESLDYEPLYPLVRRAVDQPAEEGALDLTAGVGEARHQILDLWGETVEPRQRGVPRWRVRRWLFAPSLTLRPPAGWQKLLMSYRLELAGATRFETTVALRPIPNPSPGDGLVLEVWISEAAGGRTRRLGVEYLHPAADRYWEGRRLTYDLTAGGEGEELEGGEHSREVVLTFAAYSGPALEEIWDEVILQRPTVIAAGRESPPRLLPVARLEPKPRRAIARFDDPEPFEAGSRIWPSDGRIATNLGLLRLRRGEREAAAEALRRAVELAPEEPEGHLALAELYLAEGEQAAALREYESTLRYAPRNQRALEKGAELALEVRGDRRRAERLARRALKQDPSSAGAHIAMAWVELAASDAAAAGRHLVAAAAAAPDNRDLLELINRHHPEAVIEIGERRLTRAREPVPAAAVKLRPTPLSPSVAPSAPFAIEVELTNGGTTAWPALGQPDGTLRILLVVTLEAAGEDPTETSVPLPHDVQPGQTVTLEAGLVAPATPGSYAIRLRLEQSAGGAPETFDGADVETLLEVRSGD